MTSDANPGQSGSQPFLVAADNGGDADAANQTASCPTSHKTLISGGGELTDAQGSLVNVPGVAVDKSKPNAASNAAGWTFGAHEVGGAGDDHDDASYWRKGWGLFAYAYCYRAP